jgi:hypothetical protein
VSTVRYWPDKIAKARIETDQNRLAALEQRAWAIETLLRKVLSKADTSPGLVGTPTRPARLRTVTRK